MSSTLQMGKRLYRANGRPVNPWRIEGKYIVPILKLSKTRHVWKRSAVDLQWFITQEKGHMASQIRTGRYVSPSMQKRIEKYTKELKTQ